MNIHARDESCATIREAAFRSGSGVYSPPNALVTGMNAA